MHATNFDLKGLWSRCLGQLDGRRLVAEAFADLSGEKPLVHVIAIGKAAGPMAQGAMDVLGEATGRVIVVAGGPEGVPENAELHLGDHPFPGRGSFAAGRALMQAAEEIRSDGGRAIVLLSGGGSALAELPAPGLSEEDLRLAHRALVQSGAPIEAMNRIRGRLSAIKAGGLARVLGSSLRWEGVIVDIPSGDPAAVASGPCRPPKGDQIGGVDRRVLATPKSLAELAARLGVESGTKVRLRPEVVSGIGAEALAAEAIEHLEHHGGLWVAAGEVSVPLPASGPSGRGGRAQHLSLFVLREAIARLPEQRKWAFLAAGSDGRDGEGAAGAMVHEGLGARIEDIRSALESCSSGELHRRLGTLLLEQPPRTNLTDLYLAWAQ